MIVFVLTILMLSDTGATASTSLTRNFVDPQACAVMQNRYNRTAEIKRLGHVFQIIGTATCTNDGRGGPPAVSAPDPTPDIEVPYPFNQIVPPAAYR